MSEDIRLTQAKMAWFARTFILINLDFLLPCAGKGFEDRIPSTISRLGQAFLFGLIF